jgi:hypothetical protein
MNSGLTHPVRSLFTHTVGIVFAVLASTTIAAPIPTTDYALSEITGSFAWGFRDNNNVSASGYVNNATDLGVVATMMQDGLDFGTHSGNSSGPGPNNTHGVYDGDGNAAGGLEFASGVGTLTLDSLTFHSSRSYSGGTIVEVDVRSGGGGWTNVVSTTSGALGIITGLT